MSDNNKPTCAENPVVQRENRIRCAVGQPGDPRVPTIEELWAMINEPSDDVEIDIADLEG